MKNLICILVVSFVGNILSAHTAIDLTNPEPETVNVMAFSGLKIRTAPGLESQVLKVIPFGERVNVLEKSEISENVEWFSGQWIKVEYQGIEGYVFDGFVSDLPVPSYEFELTKDDLQLCYPILAWTEYHYDEVLKPDTSNIHGVSKIHQYMENGILLSREESDYHMKSTLELHDIRISDAYNLLRSMCLTKAERKEFENNSVFISNRENEIDQIKINLQNPVHIKKQRDGNIKITAITFFEGCAH